MKTACSIVLAALMVLPAMADYLNPCGIIHGGDAWFKIGLRPADFHDSEVEWHQSGSGSVSFPDGNHGREVRVRGVDCGDVKLEVQIGDARSNRPCFHAKVVTNSVVGVSMWVVSDGTTPAVAPDATLAMLSKADEIWKQAGISFRLDDYCVTNRPDMLDVGYSSTNGLPTIYDVASLNPAVGVLKAYFVSVIHGAGTNVVVNGTTTRHGIVISANARINTLAHEIGHALGLKDVYAVMGAITNMVAVVSTAGAMAMGGDMPTSTRADEEKAFQSLVAFSGFDHQKDVVAAYEAAFEQVDRDKECMTRVLIRLAEEATMRYSGIDHTSSQDVIECNGDLWWSMAKHSIGCLGEYGTRTAIPFLESVLTNDVCGASAGAMDAYVKLAWDDGRAFDFIKQHFGDGKNLLLETGGVLYLTLKGKLADKNLSEATRKEYVGYLLKRAACKKSSVNGKLLDGILVENVPGYRDSEERKTNLQAIQKQTVKSFRMIRTPKGMKVVEGELPSP